MPSIIDRLIVHFQELWRGEVITVSWKPRAFLFKNFLNETECDHIIDRVNLHFPGVLQSKHKASMCHHIKLISMPQRDVPLVFSKFSREFTKPKLSSLLSLNVGSNVVEFIMQKLIEKSS